MAEQPAQPTPLKPRITKSTSIAVITALFPKTSDLLKRFELVSKPQASLWDGERDGLREAIKLLPDGQYDNVVFSKSKGTPVTYPNAEGKYYLEDGLITTIPRNAMMNQLPVVALQCGLSPEELVDAILHRMQGGKDQAVNFVTEIYVGTGFVVDNDTLYKSEGSTKATIAILPESEKAP